MTLQRLIEIATEHHNTQAYTQCHLYMSSELGEYILLELKKRCNDAAPIAEEPPIFVEVKAMHKLKFHTLSGIPIIYDDTLINVNEWQLCSMRNTDIIESGIVARV